MRCEIGAPALPGRMHSLDRYAFPAITVHGKLRPSWAVRKRKPADRGGQGLREENALTRERATSVLDSGAAAKIV